MNRDDIRSGFLGAIVSKMEMAAGSSQLNSDQKQAFRDTARSLRDEKKQVDRDRKYR